MKRPRVLLRPIDYDPSHGDAVTCAMCLQKWPSHIEMSLHPDTGELRLDGLILGKLRPSEVPAMDVLIRAFPRHLTRSQMVDAVYDSRPDADIPSATAITNVIKQLSQRLCGTKYMIEQDRHLGYRLITVELLEAERRFNEAQMPSSRSEIGEFSKTRAKRKSTNSVITKSREKALAKRRKQARAVRPQ